MCDVWSRPMHRAREAPEGQHRQKRAAVGREEKTTMTAPWLTGSMTTPPLSSLAPAAASSALRGPHQAPPPPPAEAASFLHNNHHPPESLFDYNATPLAPPGIKVSAHVKPNSRASWAPHPLLGWYIGPAMEHYHCYHVWLNDTCTIRICDTVVWFPHKIPMPGASSNDLVQASLQDILKVLKFSSPMRPPPPSHCSLCVAGTRKQTHLFIPEQS